MSDLFEFILDGPPVSQQTRRRERLRDWRLLVRHEAELRWRPGATPFLGPVMLSVTYYFDTVAGDVDNIVKPIQDALIGLVYFDDGQITDVSIRKRNLNRVRIGDVSGVLAEGFGRGREFLYIVAQAAPDQESV